MKLFKPNVQKIKEEKDVLTLIKALRDNDQDVRTAARNVLVKIGAPAIDPLMTALKDSNKDVCEAAAEALRQIGVTLLKDENKDVRKVVTEALGQIGDARAIDLLCTALKDSSLEVRKAAAEALIKIGTSAMEPLCVTLKDNDPDVRKAAAEVLERIGLPADPAMRAWYAVVKRDWNHATSLGTAAIDPLCIAIKDKNMDVRKAAAEALGQIGDARAVEPLCKALKDNEANIRKAAVAALIKIGTPATELLCTALKDNDPDVRRDTAKTLGQIRDKRAMEPLCAALKDNNSDVRKAAAEALDKIGLPADPATRAQHAIAKQDWNPQELAILQKFGNDLERLEHAAGELTKASSFEGFLCYLILAKIFPNQLKFWRGCGIALYNVDDVVLRKQVPGLLPYENAQKAVTYLNKALEIDPNDHLTWYWKGFCLSQIGYITENKSKLKEGLDCFDQALRTRPGDHDTIQAKQGFQTMYNNMQQGRAGERKLESTHTSTRFCRKWNETIELENSNGRLICITHGHEAKCSSAMCKYSLAASIRSRLYGEEKLPDYTSSNGL